MRKVCDECNLAKDLDQFWKNKAKPDGYFSKCINCCRTRRRSNCSKKGTGDGYANNVLASLRDSDDFKGVSGHDY